MPAPEGGVRGLCRTHTTIFWSIVIFSTKDRKPLIVPEIRAELFAYMGGIIREMKGSAKIVYGMADHVHGLL